MPTNAIIYSLLQDVNRILDCRKNEIKSEKIPNYLKNVLRNPDYVKLVFEKEKEILAYLIATESSDPPVFEGRVGLILELSVVLKHRNKGIGEKLLGEIEKYFNDDGIKRIECMVSYFNEVSRGFWSKNGYEPYNVMCVKILP